MVARLQEEKKGGGGGDDIHYSSEFSFEPLSFGPDDLFCFFLLWFFFLSGTLSSLSYSKKEKKL